MASESHMKNNKDTDLELVRRVQSGNKTAFDVLVLKYQSKIITLVMRFVKDHHEAEDVAQEAFIKAYKGLATFRGDSAFYTWLYRIAVNTAKKHLISKSRKVVSDGVDAQDAEQFEGADKLKDFDSPESNILSDELRAVVIKSMDKLPEDLREAIVLRELDGLSYEEISQVMACPIGTVRSRIFRAREAIENDINALRGRF